MKKLSIILLFIGLVFTIKSTAQQDPMYSMYVFDKMIINPGYTGSSGFLVTTVKHRQQFAGMEGAPTTQTFNIHSPIGKRFVGLGFKVIRDQIAVMNNLNATAYYSYHLNMGGGKLSVGLETGIYNRSIDYTQLILNEQGDQAIPIGATNSVVPDASWGIYFQKNLYYIGISQNHMIASKFKDQLAGEPNSKLYSHLHIMAGTEWDFKKNLSLEPNVLLKSVSGAPAQIDLNLLLYYKDKIAVGALFRTGDAIGGIFRVNISDNLRASYSYDLTISNLSTYSGGAHEFVLSYGVALPPPPTQKEIHPRYYF